MKPNRLLSTTATVLLLIGPPEAQGFQKPQRAPLANLDRRPPPATPATVRPSAPSPGQAEALDRLRECLPEARVEFDARLETPKVVHARDGFLSGPGGRGRGIPEAALGRIAVGDPHRTAKAFLHEHRTLFGHGPEALDRARLKREYVTPHNGMRTAIWEQRVDGIPVFEAVLAAHTTRQGELVMISSRFMADPDQAANAGADERDRRHRPTLSAREAVVEAARGLDEPVAFSEVTAEGAPGGSAEQSQRFTAKPFNRTIDTRLVWLPMNGRLLRLCWELVLTSRARGETFRLLVDARSGEVWLRRCLTFNATSATYRVFASDSPSPFSPGHAAPSTNQPPGVPRVLVTWTALDTNASPNGWIDDGVNEPRGNNVVAHLDRDGNDVPDLPRPQAEAGRVFDFPVDLSQPPSDYGEAAVVHLFYWCNWMHDRLYDLGFTEAAGNFQGTNFGRGGAGNDAVWADAQDGSGLNNANFTTAPDGSSSRIQMFLFDGPTPNRDPDLDAEIILHEYAHGLTDRLVGGGIGITELQSAGLAEGWSDFYSLALLSEASDDPQGAYPAAGYSSFLFRGLRQNYYFGIRRYPYSTNLARNPLTLRDLDPTQASAHAQVPLSPIFSPFNPADAVEVHNQGEVWCAALWEVRANLIAKHGFAAGNRLALQLVTDGLKLAPPDPDYLQARDAILQAERVNTGGANRLELWRGFAKRGMGFSASVPPPTTTEGIGEAFDLPDDLQILPSTGFTSSGPVGGPFSVTTWAFTLTNTGTNALSWSLVNTSLWLSASPTSGSIPPDNSGTEVTVGLNLTASQRPEGIYADTLVFTNRTSGVGQSRTFTLRVAQPDYFTEWFTASDNDLSFQTFTFRPDGSTSFYTVCRNMATNLPTDPTGGTRLALQDDSFQSLALSNGAAVSVYERRTNVFFIGSNGYLTLGEGDAEYTESPDAHFQLPRVSALFDDLDPEVGGTISWKQLSNRVAVTFLNVPEYNRPSSFNSFQIELFFDGQIRLTYMALGARDGLAGLSRGLGPPVGFEESDLMARGPCLAPLIVSVPAQLAEGAGVLIGQGRVSLAAPPTDSLTVTLASSDTTEVLVPASVVLLAGQTQVPFDFAILDDLVLDGTQIALITAAAPGYASGTASIAVTDRETATLSLALPSTVMEGEGLREGIVQIDAAPLADVVVHLASDDPSEIQVPASVTVPAGQTWAAFSVVIVDDTEIDGAVPATITAHEENWVDGTARVTVGDNESLALTVALPSLATEGDGVLPGAGSVGLSGTLTTNLLVSLTSVDPTELAVSPSVLIAAGQRSNQFDLTVVDDSMVDGRQTATVTASAAGFVSGSVTMEVWDDESPPMPSDPRPADGASDVSASLVLGWNNLRRDLITNGGFETSDFTGWVKTNAGAGEFVINDGTRDPAGPGGPLLPFAGRYSAMTDPTGFGTYTLYQDVVVPPGGTPVLQWQHCLRNYAPAFTSTQYFRVEIRDAGHTPRALAFSTQPGDLLRTDWSPHEYDLSAFRGQPVRVVFEEQDSIAHLSAFVDEVRITGGISGPPLTNEVYFGTNPTPGPAEFQGRTTNTLWALPRLAPATTYYWQIVPRGAGVTPGPVWRFTTRGVHHFEWAPVPSPQIAQRPFPATLTARDEFNSTVSNFTGSVHLTALLSDGPALPQFGDDFEDGDGAGWEPGTGAYRREVSSETAAGGRHSFTLIGGSRMHLNGVSHALPNLTPDWITFHVRSGDTRRSGGYFLAGSGPRLQDIIAFFYMAEGGQMGLADRSSFHGVPFEAQQWYKVSLAFSWSQRTVDLFVDDSLVAAAISFQSDTATNLAALHLYNYDNMQTWWDEIAAGQGELPRSVPLVPAQTGPFVNGTWTGNLAVPEPAPAVSLVAADDQRHVGTSHPLLVMGIRLNAKVTGTGSTLLLSWNSLPGLVYRVDYQADLGSTNWTSLGGSTTASDTLTATTDEIRPGMPRFYRVVLLP